MSDVRVDTTDLRRSGTEVLSAAAETATVMSRVHDGLLEAQAGWRGVSRSALVGAIERWEQQHTQLHTRLTELGEKLAEAAARYDTADDDAAQRMKDAAALVQRMGL